METTSNSFADKVINGLKKSVAELEEFRMQLALGKAQASEKYEEIKKKLNEIIHEVKLKINDSKENVNEVRAKLEELQLQLALGKADTKDAFEAQKKKILKSVHDIETLIKENSVTAKLYSKLSIEMEKFKIKLEILQLRFSLEKLDVRDEFEAKKADFLKKVEEIKKNGLARDTGKSWEHFSSEINEAYIHLKKAFIKS